MAQPYLDQLQELVVSLQPNNPDLICKHFFSGAALYVENKLCASLTPKGLAFKLPKSHCEQLIEAGKATPLRDFDNSPIKKSYILLPEPEGISDSEKSAYLQQCICHAASLDT